jgi:hypothetical protein
MQRMTMLRRIGSFLGLLLAAHVVAIAGCGGGNNPTSSPTPTPTVVSSTSFKGTVAGSGGRSGTIAITVQAKITAAAVRALASPSASAVITFSDGSTVALTGTYDSNSGTLSITGGGYSVAGTIANDQVSGTFTAPDGGTGIFTLLDATQATVTNYCGTFTEPDDHGVWDFEVSATGTLAGNAFGNHFLTLSGSVVGDQLAIQSSRGGTVTGTISGNTVSGTIIPAPGTSGGGGTFTGSVCA